ncbi:MAG: arsenate reductase ArsC [Desulforhopalus sp.]
MNHKLKILFLCTGNSCRSQMAEGWTRALKGDLIDVFSAGVEIHGLNPLAVQVMSEVDVDITNHTSQHVDQFKNHNFDAIITVCGHAHEHCPLLPGRCRVVHVGFDDPPLLAQMLAEEGASMEDQLNCYRRVRDEIRAYVETLPHVLNIRGENHE